MHGLQAYIVNGVRSAAAKGKMALYQPLTLLDLVVYYKENASIKRIKEIKCLHPYHSLHADVKKSAIALFLNEVLNKTVKDESHTQDLFAFISTSLIMLDDLDKEVENFHLIFLIGLSRHLGFGAHTVSEVLSGRMVDQEIEMKLSEVLGAQYDTSLKITIAQRRELLDILVKFYKSHIDSLGEFRSVQVLKDVLG